MMLDAHYDIVLVDLPIVMIVGVITLSNIYTLLLVYKTIFTLQ